MPSPFRFHGLPRKPTLLLAAVLATGTLLPFTQTAHAAAAQPTPAQQVLPAGLEGAINDASAVLPRARDLDAAQRKQAEDLLRDALADD
ncbi:MAG TPA: hypothetical protein VF497_15540, partial [Rudaea sp.]